MPLARLLRHAVLLPALGLLLAACASPLERCEARATHDLRVIDSLIAETEANIARGYAISRTPEHETRLELCMLPSDSPFLFCEVDTIVMREHPVAIDRAEERRKLASLTAARQEAEARARRALAACRAEYPQG